MSKGIFTDKTLKPSETDILKIVGSAKTNWDLLLRHVKSDLRLNWEFKFYGVNYGWALGFNKNGKSIVALYPDKDCFTVQIILNKHQVDSTLLMDLDVGIIEYIRNKEAIHEGKWIYIKIDKKTDLHDIIKIIDIRLKIK